MLAFLKRIFGVKPADPTPAPYKVEASQFPFPKAEQEKKPAAKKPAAKKSTARKPKTPKA